MQSALANGAGDLLGVFMLAAFIVTAGCALVCVGLSWWQARLRRRRAADAVMVVVQSQFGDGPGSLAADGRDKLGEATAWPEQFFRVRRVTSTLFEVEELPAGAHPAAEPELPSVPFAVEECATTAASSPVDDSEEMCEVCCEAQPEMVFLPCLHGGICRSCAEQIVRRSNKHCHTCRRAIDKVVLVEEPLELLRGSRVIARRVL
mmetsp:Transcript_18677/g.38870  ORF Transcript_18677/g.38870 Transcript_18677/m.38870 type:complete len:205 (+) Transcript_18677:1-615(+)